MDETAIRGKIDEYGLINEVFSTGALTEKERGALQKRIRAEIRTLAGL